MYIKTYQIKMKLKDTNTSTLYIIAVQETIRELFDNTSEDIAIGWENIEQSIHKVALEANV